MTSIEKKIEALEKGAVVVIGVPLDENSSFLRGAALGPPRIREVLHSGSSNMMTESGLDLAKSPGWVDLGDLELPQGANALDFVEKTSLAILSRDARMLSLGGDHSITYPIIRAFAGRFKPLTILQIDAHPDTYDVYNGNRRSHACPFARIMEEGLVERLVQVGVRTINPHQREQAERFGIEVIEMKDWSIEKVPRLKDNTYLSIDLDGLDPAFAPGVSHHEPGGLSTRDALRIVHRLPPELVGADIVEFNPARDSVGITAMVAAKLYKELVGHMLRPTPAQKS